MFLQFTHTRQGRNTPLKNAHEGTIFFALIGTE